MNYFELKGSKLLMFHRKCFLNSQEINNKVVICWTTIKTTSDTYATVTLPVSYTNTTYKVLTGQINQGDTDWLGCISNKTKSNYRAKTKSNYRAYINNGTMDCMSIGY